MRTNIWLAAGLAALLAVGPAVGQGKGQGKGKEGRNAPAAQASKQQRGNERADRGKPQQASKAQRGNAADRSARPDKANRGNAAAPGKVRAERGAKPAVRANVKAKKAKAREHVQRLPEGFRSLSRSDRTVDRFVVGAAALAAAHGLGADALALRIVDDRFEVRNRRGDVLFDMNEDRARRLGVWNLSVVDDRDKQGSPAFCRSGEGHPVWGREWCIDKGFGLGSDNGRVWSRGSVEDIIFGRRVERDRLDRPSLIEILGDVVFGRLALHSLALGFDEPLVGVWVAEPQAPRLLRINAGPQPVAELVDLNGDNRVDVLYVVHDGN